MSFRMRPATHFWQVADGVQIQTWEGEFVIRGPQSLYTLCERLMALLDAGTTRTELLAAVPAGVHDVAIHVLNELVKRNAVIDTTKLTVTDVTPEVRSAFGDTIGYLESVSSDPYAAFDTFRKANVLAVGRGVSYFAAVRGLVNMGVGHLDCRPCDGSEGVDRLRQLVARGDVQVTAQPVRCLNEALASSLPWTLAVYVRDGFDAGELALFNASSTVAQNRIFAIVTRGAGIVGPMVQLDADDRLDCAIGHLSSRNSELLDGTAPPGPVLATMTGNIVSLQSFRYLTGAEPVPTGEKITVVHGDTLESSVHTMDGIQERPVADDAALRDRIDAFRTVASSSTEVFLEASSALGDSLFGVVTDSRPGLLPQVPLSLSSCTPNAYSNGTVAPVLGVGVTEVEARGNALVEALREMARRGDDCAHLRSVGLDDDALTNVKRTSFHMAAGHSFQAWLSDGLQRVVLQRVLSEATSGRVHWVRVVCTELSDVDGRTWCRTLTERFGRSISVLCAHAAQLPSGHGAAVLEDHEIMAAGAGTTSDGAVASALRAALARVQVEEGGWSAAMLPHIKCASAREGVACYGSNARSAAEHTEWVSTMRLGLRRLNEQVVVRPWGGDAVLQRGLLLGWVGIKECI